MTNSSKEAVLETSNGKRITLKGVNRHSFRPESGRALDPADCLADARLLKEMNMNSVRCSHYPPDKAFHDACDQLGLYVIDELCTWQKPCLDAPTATRLIQQLVRRDANHPSILWWANGNEGGWNKEVDGEFPRWDVKQAQCQMVSDCFRERAARPAGRTTPPTEPDERNAKQSHPSPPQIPRAPQQGPATPCRCPWPPAPPRL